jgi:hypothetical protein
MTLNLTFDSSVPLQRIHISTINSANYDLAPTQSDRDDSNEAHWARADEVKLDDDKHSIPDSNSNFRRISNRYGKGNRR